MARYRSYNNYDGYDDYRDFDDVPTEYAADTQRLLRQLKAQGATLRLHLLAEEILARQTPTQTKAMQNQVRAQIREGNAELREHRRYLRELNTARHLHQPLPPNPRFQPREWRQWCTTHGRRD